MDNIQALGLAVKMMRSELDETLDKRAGVPPNDTSHWRRTWDQRIAQLRPAVRRLERLRERAVESGGLL